MVAINNSEMNRLMQSSMGVANNWENSSTGEKAEFFTNSIMTILSMFESSQSEVNNSKKDQENFNKKVKNIENSIEKSSKKIAKAMQDAGKYIQKQIDLVAKKSEKLEKEQKKADEKQKEINEQLENITRLQGNLASATDPAEQKRLLGEIKDASSKLGKAIESMSTINDKVVDLQGEVQNIKEDIDVKQEDVEQIKTSLKQENENELKNAQQGRIDAAAQEPKAKEDEAAAEAAQLKAQVPFANAQAIQDVANYTMAATTRTSTATQGLQKVSTMLVGIENNKGLIGQFDSSVLDKITTFNGAIGTWDSSVNSLITAVGSYQNANIDELNNAVETDLQTIESGAQPSDKTNNVDGKKNNVKNVSSQENQNSNESGETSNNTLLTPNVKLKFGLEQ